MTVTCQRVESSRANHSRVHVKRCARAPANARNGEAERQANVRKHALPEREIADARGAGCGLWAMTVPRAPPRSV